MNMISPQIFIVRVYRQPPFLDRVRDIITGMNIFKPWQISSKNCQVALQTIDIESVKVSVKNATPK